MKIKKLINLQKQKKSNVIDDVRKLSLGSLYFVGPSAKTFNGNEVITMPISIGQNITSLYFIAAHKYNILKNSDKSTVIFPSKIHKLLAKTVGIFNVKINKKSVNMIFNAFALENASIGNVIVAKIGRTRIEFLDYVTVVDNEEIPELKLYLIKRIININEWPAIAIKKWATHHLRLGSDSINYIYSNYIYSSNLYDRKNLVNVIQKHHTYNANKNRQ